jgi:cytochrome c oxidase subunit I
MTIQQHRFWPMAWFLLGAALLVAMLLNSSGVVLANAGVDRSLQNTYYVVSHLHNLAFVLFYCFGTSITLYFVLGRRIANNYLLSFHWLLSAIGFVLLQAPSYLLSLNSMPRKYEDYPAAFAHWNYWQTIASWLPVAGLVFLGLAAVTFKARAI